MYLLYLCVCYCIIIWRSYLYIVVNWQTEGCAQSSNESGVNSCVDCVVERECIFVLQMQFMQIAAKYSVDVMWNLIQFAFLYIFSHQATTARAFIHMYICVCVCVCTVEHVEGNRRSHLPLSTPGKLLVVVSKSKSKISFH